MANKIIDKITDKIIIGLALFGMAIIGYGMFYLSN